MNNPKVSVLMPAYNTEKYIGEAIESILNQTFYDFEFIIVDDCSTDRTWEIIQEYAKKDGRMVALRNEENLGIAGNRNKLVSLAKGKYVVWQDSDDISMPYRIDHQYEFMENNPEIGICGGWLQFFDERGDKSIRKYASDDETLRRKIFRYSPVAQPAAIIHREHLQKEGEYNLNYPPAEDIDMSFRIGRENKFANLSEVLIRYRESINSATFTKLKIVELNTIAIRKKHCKISGYKMSISDKIYNCLQYFSIFLIPPKIKIRLFNFFRNSK